MTGELVTMADGPLQGQRYERNDQETVLYIERYFTSTPDGERLTYGLFRNSSGNYVGHLLAIQPIHFHTQV